MKLTYLVSRLTAKAALRFYAWRAHHFSSILQSSEIHQILDTEFSPVPLFLSCRPFCRVTTRKSCITSVSSAYALAGNSTIVEFPGARAI